MIIGLTGPRYSGKTEVAKILSVESFRVLGFGDEVRLERDARGLPPDTDLHKLGVDLINEFGPQYWGVRVAGRMDLSSGADYVVEGMRTMGDLEVFKKFPKFVLVGVTAPLDVRYQRCLDDKRGRPEDVKDYGDFIRRCQRDESSLEGGLGSRDLFDMRKHTIQNNTDITGLKLRTLGLLNLRE